MITQHSGGVSGEKRWVPLGTQLAENPSGMNESHDSHSSIRRAQARSSPLRTSNKPRLRNGHTLLPLRDRTVCKLNSTGLKIFTAQEGLATAEKSVLVAADSQLSTLQDPTSEMSAASTA